MMPTMVTDQLSSIMSAGGKSSQDVLQGLLER